MRALRSNHRCARGYTGSPLSGRRQPPLPPERPLTRPSPPAGVSQSGSSATRRAAGGNRGPRARAPGAPRDQGNDRARVHHRAPAPAPAPAGSTPAPRRSRLPHCGSRRYGRNTEDSVKGASKRARATLEERLAAADRQRPPQAGNIDGLVALLTDDALFTMPPAPRLIVLTIQGDQVAGLTCFLDTSVLPCFGLPPDPARLATPRGQTPDLRWLVWAFPAVAPMTRRTSRSDHPSRDISQSRDPLFSAHVRAAAG